MALRAILLLALLAPAVLATSTPLLQQLQSSQFSGFMKLLEISGMVSEIEAAVQTGSSLTVFAPTDEALLYHTSPTLLAYLKRAENKETLRAVLRSHFVPKALSPFQWEGTHKTLAGSDIPLSMDAESFYAGTSAIVKYNAVIGSDGAVHSIPTLMVPESLGASAKMFVADSNVRRVLQAAAPAPAPATGGPITPDAESPPAIILPSVPSTNAGHVSAAASFFMLCSALAAALLF